MKGAEARARLGKADKQCQLPAITAPSPRASHGAAPIHMGVTQDEAKAKIAARLGLARKQCKEEVVKQKQLLVARQAKGNEMSLTLEQLERTHFAPHKKDLRHAVDVLR